MKRCSCCKEIKPRCTFWNNSHNKDGLQHYCILCFKNYAPRKKAWRKYESKYIRLGKLKNGYRPRILRKTKNIAIQAIPEITVEHLPKKIKDAVG